MNESKNVITLSPAEQRRMERFDRKSTAVAEKMLQRIRELSHCPESLAPFLETLERIYVQKLEPRRPKDVPLVGTYCVMVPPELVYAQGAMPVKLCSGSYTAFGVGDDLAPRDACPLVKAVMGFEDVDAMPVYKNCALMAVPVTCDCKKKLAGWLAERRPTALLHVPANRDRDEDMERFAGELYGLSRQLTSITGTALSYDNLEAACGAMADAQYELSRFIELRKKHPLIIRGSFSMAVMNALSYTWVIQVTAMMSKALDLVLPMLSRLWTFIREPYMQNLRLAREQSSSLSCRCASYTRISRISRFSRKKRKVKNNK